jgi:cyclopropane-fatty-acyl-phospholipid synthase
VEEVMTNMKEMSDKQLIQQLLQLTDIKINGNQPWDIHIHDEQFYTRVIRQGVLGLGESYMDKWWDCQRLDIFFYKILQAELDTKVTIPFLLKIKYLFLGLINLQTKIRAKQVAAQHYDLGNDLFTTMLDTHMNYSCGYWKEAHTLEEAQIQKLELICQKLQLKPGMQVLDIGCGWGGFAHYAATHYGVNVVGITISEQQYEYAKRYCQDLPVQFRLQDYRDLLKQSPEQFDRIVSVGMFEHVGSLNYKTFMHIVHQALSKDGLFLLHTIGSGETYPLTNAWIHKYIFPNGVSPSIAQVGTAAEKLFVMEDWHNFGAYYDPTLMAWYENFTQGWDKLKMNPTYDERFYRMWSYYLLSCAGSFRARVNQLWQIVFSKKGVSNGYRAPR